ncbi:MAG: glycosyl transferase, group 1 family [Clostridiaceae bacterium]|jgi:glycosyltransferase involved in cell wall biosynthesis|nr:glycosyl transferase, group 1 family [Clostridiaceae bacterium]
MKNVMIINLARQYGGAEKVTEDILFNINKKKYNVFLVCLSNSRFYNEIINKTNNTFTILTLPYKKSSVLKYFIKTIKYINSNDIQIIHAHGAFSSLVGTICGKIKKIKVITTIHGRADFDRNQGLRAKIYKFMEVFLHKYNKYYLTVSEDLKKHMVESGLTSDKVLVMHNGISAKIKTDNEINYKEKFFKKNDFMIASIGRLTKVKGHIYLLEALKKLNTNNIEVKCLIVGEGELQQYISEKIIEYNLDGNVKLIGFINNIDDIIMCSDAVVMTSLMEGLPLTILEAFRDSTIVLAPRVGGIPEVINHGENGLLYNSLNTDEIADELTKIKYKNYDLDTIKKNAFNSFLENWTTEKFIENTEKVYDSL